MTYTLTGKVATSTDANHDTTRYAYDVLDRVTSVTDPEGRVTTYGYDALGRQVSISNPAIQSTPLLQKAYTPDGLLASLTDANSHTTGFAYDGLDRLATTTYPLGSTEAFSYDADNNILTRQTRAGAVITFTYDTLNRLATKTPPSPAAVVTYGYDLAGHLTGVSDTSAAITAAVPPSPGTSVQYAASYAYDAMNRPTAVNWSPAPVPAASTAASVTFGHSYNAANQRVGQSISDNSWVNYPARTASTTSYTANALNQYTAVGLVSPSYDGNGNLTSDGTFTLGYDAENRLISASGAGNTASYAFDAQGRRKTKTVNGSTTVFVTDADNREVLEYDGTSGAILRWYAYGLGPNDVLSQTNVAAGTRATLVPDILGSIIASQDSGSGALTKVGYQPYGKSGGTGPFGFTGQRIDLETNGLYYYRARHYSPAWGRFMQVDPIGYVGGVNLYAYVGNSPINWIDPFGRAGLAATGELNPSFYPGISSNVQTVVGIALEACAAACDPGVQMSIGDPLGALAFRGLNTFAKLGSATDRAASLLPEFNGTTTGVLITDEGQINVFQSGRANAFGNYPAAFHAEGKAAIWFRDNESTGGVLYHNNPEGTCGHCDRQIETLLPEGKSMTVVPPSNAVAPNALARPGITTYVGNAAIPKPPISQ